jgi:hypothetical protein
MTATEIGTAGVIAMTAGTIGTITGTIGTITTATAKSHQNGAEAYVLVMTARIFCLAVLTRSQASAAKPASMLRDGFAGAPPFAV